MNNLNRSEELKISCRHHDLCWGYCPECQTVLAYEARKHGRRFVAILVLTVIGIIVGLFIGISLQKVFRHPGGLLPTEPLLCSIFVPAILGAACSLYNLISWYSFKNKYDNKKYFDKIKK